MTLRMAVPNKGRLSDRSVEILKRAGLDIENGGERKLYAPVKNMDFEIMFLRAQDIVRFVHTGAVDLGITGKDLVMESGLDMEIVQTLNYGYCRLSVASPEGSGIDTIDDVPDGAVVATSFPHMTNEFFESKGKKVKITAVSGAAEVTPRIGVADIIVDLVSSGSTLKGNRLKEIDTILESWAVVVANKESLKVKEEEIRELTEAIRSVTDAEGKKYLMADVPKEALEEIKSFLPGIAGPTVMNIMGRDDCVAIHVVVDKDKVYESVTRLKKLGASGILIMPIDRMVP
jgi:ATP phosphoribosyltransferase